LFSHILTGCKAQQKPRTGFNIFAYLTEEFGEVATEINIEQGYSTKPPGKDGIIGECVDVMVCVIDLIRHYYPDVTEQELVDIATNKLAKWK
jgi:NTP pyrophosphatase (non-canonical NTP hydrolase)